MPTPTTTTAFRISRETREQGEARTLDRIVDSVPGIEGIWAHQVNPGDWVVVRTRNSTYSLASQGDGVFRVAGGWFALSGDENRDVKISGCTWGGAVIHTRLVAAPGMFLEFDNGVRTTRIRDVRLIRGGEDRKH